MGFSEFPWRRGLGNDANKVFDNQGRVVANSCGFQDGNLIAAAPDLLAACKEFVLKVDLGKAKSTHSYTQMNEAIKKATYGQ